MSKSKPMMYHTFNKTWVLPESEFRCNIITGLPTYPTHNVSFPFDEFVTGEQIVQPVTILAVPGDIPNCEFLTVARPEK